MRGRGLVAVTIAAGCLGGCAPAASPPGPTPTDIPVPTPVTVVATPAISAWYAGLVVHVDSVTTVLDHGVGSVTFAIRIDNPGRDPATIEAPVLLVSGQASIDPRHGTTLPEVAPGGTAAMTLPFDVDAAFDTAHASLRIGRVAEHVIVVPVGAGGQPPVVLAPVELALGGRAAAGALRVALTGGELRADLPDFGLELGVGTLALTVRYDVRFSGTFAGGFAFTGANIALRLPGGTTVAARTDGHSQSAAVVGPGQVVLGLASRFDVPAPGTGGYALVIRNGRASATIPFTIATPVGGG